MNSTSNGLLWIIDELLKKSSCEYNNSESGLESSTNSTFTNWGIIFFFILYLNSSKWTCG